MTLPASGVITMAQVNTELGLSSTANITLNDTAVRNLFGVTSGAISMSNGYGKSVPSGQIIISPNGINGGIQVASFTVPTGVYSISVLLVGHPSGNQSSLTVDGTTMVSTSTVTTSSTQGGGTGGTVGAAWYDPDGIENPKTHTGGGGAGGYTGSGGAAGNQSNGGFGQVGSGGGGGGGDASYWPSVASGGGGIGLYGQGSNGAANGGGGSGGSNGSYWYGGTYGGGSSNAVGSSYPLVGGNVQWRNNISVTPSSVVLVYVMGAYYNSQAASYFNYSGGGACRIVWGLNRNFPSTNVGNF